MVGVDCHATAVEIGLALVLTEGRKELNDSRFTCGHDIALVLGLAELSIDWFSCNGATIVSDARIVENLTALRLSQ